MYKYFYNIKVYIYNIYYNIIYIIEILYRDVLIKIIYEYLINNEWISWFCITLAIIID